MYSFVMDILQSRFFFPKLILILLLESSSRDYVAAAYASIFPKTPITNLANRTFGISEIQVSGSEIAKALEEKHGSAPTVYRQSLDEIEAQIRKCLDDGSSFAAVWYYRWMWGSGLQVESIGEEIWDVEGYEKRDLGNLIRGEEFVYKDIPEQVVAALDGTFF